MSTWDEVAYQLRADLAELSTGQVAMLLERLDPEESGEESLLAVLCKARLVADGYFD